MGWILRYGIDKVLVIILENFIKRVVMIIVNRFYYIFLGYRKVMLEIVLDK